MAFKILKFLLEDFQCHSNINLANLFVTVLLLDIIIFLQVKYSIICSLYMVSTLSPIDHMLLGRQEQILKILLHMSGQ